jgi:excisionase family DNA binding protein
MVKSVADPEGAVETASATEFTALPPQDGEGFQELLRLVGSRGRRPARLVGPDGTATELPAEVFEVLRQVIEVMAAGKAVTVAPHNLLLTTQEAADLLGVSRPTLVRLLERATSRSPGRTGTAGSGSSTSWTTSSAPPRTERRRWRLSSPRARTSAATTTRTTPRSAADPALVSQ